MAKEKWITTVLLNWCQNMVWSLVVEGEKKYFTLGSCRSSAQKWQMKCLGSLRLSTQKGFWRCNQPSQESQTGTSKRRSQSFCLSVFSPACQSVMPTSLSIAHSSPVKELCVWRLFLSAIRNISSWWVWLLIFFLQLTVDSCGPLECLFEGPGPILCSNLLRLVLKQLWKGTFT